MRVLICLMVAVALIFGVSACGHKSKLKTPSQIEANEQKKARKAAKEEEKAKQEETSLPLEGGGEGGGQQ